MSEHRCPTGTSARFRCVFTLLDGRALRSDHSGMALYLSVTFTNDTFAQHVYTITDDVLGSPVLSDQPLAPGEAVTEQLVADANGHGQATYGYRGGISTRRDDLNDGETVKMD